MTTITSGITLGCGDEQAAGGIQAIYVIDKSGVQSFTVDPVTSNWAYLAVTVDNSTDAVNQWHKIEYQLDTAELDAPSEVQDNFTSATEITVTSFIPNAEKVKAKTLQDLAKSCRFYAIIQLNTGAAFLFGYDEQITVNRGLSANVSQVATGDITGDNGYNLTISGTQVDLGRQFVGTIVTTGGVVVTFS